MSAAAPPPSPRRFAIWLPRPLWIAVATVVMIVVDATVQNSPPLVSSFFRSPSFVRQESGHRVHQSGRGRPAY